MKDIPFAAVKLSLYEGLARLYLSMMRNPHALNESKKKTKNSGSDLLSPSESAIVGLSSGAITGADRVTSTTSLLDEILQPKLNHN